MSVLSRCGDPSLTTLISRWRDDEEDEALSGPGHRNPGLYLPRGGSKKSWWWIRVPKSVRRYDSGTTGRGVTSILKIWEITYNNVLQRWCFFKKLTFLYSWWSKDNVRKTIYMMTIRMMIKMIFRMMKNDTIKDYVYWNFNLTSQWWYVKDWLTA